MNLKVDIVNSKVPNPLFKEPLYFQNYDDNLNFEVELLENEYYEPIPEIISSEFSTYFEINKVNKNKIEISLSEEIPEEKLEKLNYFTLIVQVNYNQADHPAKTVILIDVPKKPDPPTTTEEITTTVCPTFPTTTTCEPCTTIQPPTTTECPSTTTIITTPCDCGTTPSTETSTEDSSKTTDSSSSTCPVCPICPTSSNPGETSTCPVCPTITEPGNTSQCPVCPTNPGETITCPVCPTITDPGDTSQCPICPTNPGETTTCPVCPTTCEPCDTSQCPVSPTTSNPGETTTCPTTTEPGSTTCAPCDCSSSTESSSCKPCLPELTVQFVKRFDFHEQDPKTTGIIDKFTAVSNIDEEISYKVKEVIPTVARSKIEITEQGEINVKEEIDEGTYKIKLGAKGQKSNSEDEANLVLLLKEKAVEYNDTIFVEKSLYVLNIIEKTEPKVIVSSGDDYYYKITDDNSEDVKKDWFEIKNGDLIIQKINREDERIKSLLPPQLKIKIQAIKKNDPPVVLNSSFNKPLLQSKEIDFSDMKCLDIQSINNKPDVMVVLINVEDINDNPPIFVETSPVIVGYPNSNLAEFIVPPYLVKVTATDEDMGIHAKIKYSTLDENFVVDSDEGVIFLANEIADNYDLTITAEDNNGLGGNTATLQIKIILLKEEHICVIRLKNIEYSEIEGKVKDLSEKTNRTVKYLTSIAVPTSSKEEKQKFKLFESNEKLPEVQVVLYALDENNEIIPAKEFKKLVDDTNIGIDLQIEEYISPNHNVGWIAAVSTLSVLLALVIIGALVAYIFYFRPRMMRLHTDGYIKHVNRDSIHDAPIETKIESSTAVRRATGFPIGFTPEELDDDYEEMPDDVTDEQEQDHDEAINDSVRSSQIEPERKKSVVTFDTNVTEIEIEVEKL